jgi:NADH-quinone oxidoreductase subunit A
MDLFASNLFWPLALFFGCTLALVVIMIALSFLLGQRHKGRVTGEPYESGMPLSGAAGIRFDTKYYLVAMFFVIFDVEALFILAWAVAARESGWPGYVTVVLFVGILLAALLYLWKSRALDWGLPKKNNQKRTGEP